MIITAVICELNPVHNGHKYIFDKARELTGADYCIAIMSGDYVQRGEPAVFDKHLRTRFALSIGADAVIELPGLFATGSAQYFARGAMGILKKLGCVNYLCFGSESGDIETILSEDNDSPNDILGREYIKAIEYLGLDTKPVPVKRTGTDYNDDKNVSGTICSASYLRKNMMDGKKFNRKLLPDSCIKDFEDYIKDYEPVYFDDYSDVIYQALRMDINHLDRYFDVYSDLADKFENALPGFTTADEYCHQVKTKEIAFSHIKRALLHISLGYTKDDERYAKENDYFIYSRLLGFNKSKADVLKALTENGAVLISKTADASGIITGVALDIYEKDISASALREYIRQSKDKKPAVNEYTRSVVIL
jgi:predicted nucleotidyltransferase